MVQNPHCSSRPEPRQVAANSFTQSIPSSALNSALQTSTTMFITCLPSIYCFTIQPLFKKVSVTSSNTKHASSRNSRTEGWTIFAYIAQTAVKIKTRMQTLERRLGCYKDCKWLTYPLNTNKLHILWFLKAKPFSSVLSEY